jgi:hypothetical protein
MGERVKGGEGFDEGEAGKQNLKNKLNKAFSVTDVNEVVSDDVCVCDWTNVC